MEVSFLMLLAVLLIAWSAGLLANRLGFPAILGELAAGIIFGPALLGSVGLGFSEQIPGLPVLAEVGIFALMLYIGMEVNYRDLLREGKAGFLGALGGFIVPFGAGYGLAIFMDFGSSAGIFLGLAMGVTSLATKSRILSELNLFGTRIANVLLVGALFADVTALIVFAMALGLNGKDGLQLVDILLVAGKALVFFLIATVVGLKALPWVGTLLRPMGVHERTGHFTFVLLVGLIYAELAHLLGLHAVIGAFMAGIFLTEGVLRQRLSLEIAEAVKDMALGFLAPIFFFTVGFQVSLAVVGEQPLLVVGVIALATLTKVFGTAGFYALSGNGWREGLVIGAGMNGRGAVEIIIAEIALSSGLIDQTVFSILVLMAFFTTLTVPVSLGIGVRWLQGRGELARTTSDREGIILVGAHALGRLIALQAGKLSQTPVTLIDTNAERCQLAREQGLKVIRGSALREDVLLLAGAREADTLLAATSNGSINHLVAEAGSTLFAIPNALVARPDIHAEASGFSRKFPSVWSLTRGEHELGFWERIAETDAGDVVHYHLDGGETTPGHVRGLVVSRSVLPLFRLREGRILFAPDTSFQSGDEVIALRRPAAQSVVASRVAETVARAVVLDLPERVSASDFLRAAAAHIADRVHLNEKELVELLEQRERDFSSVIVPGLAIPHATVPGADSFELVACRAQAGVEFPGQAEPVKAIFLLLGSDDDRELHLHALAIIARMATARNFEQRWLAAHDEQDLRLLLVRASWPDQVEEASHHE